MPLSQDKIRIKIDTPLGLDVVWIVKFYGEESISTLFHFTAEVASDNSDVDFQQLLGKNVTVTLVAADQTECFLDGIVSRAVQGPTEERVTNYNIELRPWTWLLTLTQDNQIFQEKTAVEIIEKVVTDAGFSSFLKVECQGNFEKRVYCVQFQETGFEFISRLMEEEGIYYFFTHVKGKHTMVLADKPSSHLKVKALTKAEFKPTTFTSVQNEDTIIRAQFEEQVVSTSYTAIDYNMETPATKLEETVKGSDTKSKRELREWPVFVAKKAELQPLARRRIEERELPGKELRGTSHIRSFVTGQFFEMDKHPRKDLNAEWVLRWISHAADLSTYKNDFRAFPKTVPFRPMRTTRKPLIIGTQTAKVVGPAGEEIYTDKYGRIKLWFHWDRIGKGDEKTSCWVRVAQPWAGKKWGAMFIPRIGMEVLVSFTDGDPDRPLVTGAVYNADNMPPYDLPAKATQSKLKSRSTKKGTGFNEIRFEDKKDSEELFFHAQKDMKVMILNDLYRDTGKDEKITIKNSRTVLIKESDDNLTLEKGNRFITVSKGNETHVVKGTRDVKVTKDENHKNEKNFTHKVMKDYVLNVDGNLKITVKGDIIINGKKDIKIDAGMNYITKAKMDAKHDALQMAFKAKAKYGVEALQVELKGTMTKIEGKAMLKLEGAMFDAKGKAMAKVEGGGMLMLKGGLVKIN